MSTPSHPNNAAAGPLRIGRMPDTQLTPAQENLLRRAFAGSAEIFVEQAFHSGYSGASAYLVSREGRPPVVVKMAHPLDLQHEYNAYHEFVAEMAPQHTTRLHGELLISADEALGLLLYTFAGGDAQMRTTNLADYYQTHGGVATAAVIDRLFRDYGQHWWANHHLKRLVMGEVYDRLLPVHLQLILTAAPPPAADSVTLEAGALDLAQVRALQPGHSVMLHGFTVIKVRPGLLTLQGRAPAGVRAAPVRVRVEGVLSTAYQPGDHFAAHGAQVKATRAMLLAEAVQPILPSSDLTGPNFTHGTRSYPNPLHHVDELLDWRYAAKVSITHGDLNLQNILVDPSTGFAWLIDFGETRRGPVLFDLQRLEAQVLTKLLPPSLPPGQLAATCVVTLLEALHTLLPDERSPLPGLQEPYTVLVALRQLAAHYLADNRAWAEYYRGLALVLTGALKYAELDDTARTLALLGAATALRLIDAPLVSALPLSEQPPAPGVSPFKGLHYFDVADAELFYGREELTAELVAALSTQRFLAIVGASGSGKSSLVRAGLAPAWQRRAVSLGSSSPAPDSERWPLHIITPTAHPLESLALSLTQSSASVTATATLLDDLARDARGLHLYVRKLLTHSAHPLPSHERFLLIVDQFEELFTLCRDKGERKAFVDNLLTAVAADGPTWVVITLRADFYAQCGEFDSLRQSLERYQKYIGPMPRAALRRAIEAPAQRDHWQLEPGLVDLLLQDVGDEPGALPLLSHALLETWRRRRGRTLTLAGYAASGRVQGAIAQTAESVLRQQLTSAGEQRIIREIFLRLTELGEGAQDTRRRVALDELIPHAAARPLIEHVLKTLADARLVTIFQDEAEIAHEALIREWPTLREWLQDDREGLRTQRRLTEAAQEWTRLARDPGALYRGLRLEQIQLWAASHPATLNQLEAEFLTASQTQLDEEHRQAATLAQQREAARQRELAQAQALAAAERQRAAEQATANARLRRQTRQLLAVSLLALLFAAAAGWFGDQANRSASKLATEVAQRSTAEANAVESAQVSATRAAEANVARQVAGRQATLAFSRQLAAQSASELSQSQYERSILLAIAAGQITDTLEAFTAIRSALVSPWHSRTVFYGVNQATWSQDENKILTSNDDQTVRIWDAVTGKEVVKFVGVYSGVWSQDESKILTTGTDNIARIWDAVTGKERVKFIGANWAVWSQDESKILTSSTDKTVRIWNAVTGKELLTLSGHMEQVGQATWSKDEKKILTSSADHTARIWDAVTGQQLATLDNKMEIIGPATWSKGGSKILTTSDDQAVRIWDAVTGHLLITLRGHMGWVNQATWNKDESHILTTSDDQTARIWDAVTGQQLITLRGHTREVRQAIWSQDESRILTSSMDGTARIWDAVTGKAVVTLQGHTGVVWQAMWNKAETDILTHGSDGTARIWDVETGKQVAILTGHTQDVNQAKWSNDETHILTTSADGTIRVWDADPDPEPIRLRGHTGDVNQATWSKDEQRILTNSFNDQTVRIWDVISGKELINLSGVYAPVWNQDESKILTASNDHTARIWDTITGKELSIFRGHTGSVHQALWNKDEKKVLTISSDQTIRIWDAVTAKELVILRGHTGEIWQATWSKDEKHILTTSADQTARIWDATGNQLPVTLTGHIGGFWEAMWSKDERRILTTVSLDGKARIWHAATGQLLMTLIDQVHQATWSKDEARILTTGPDDIAYIWDGATGKQLIALIGHTEWVNGAIWDKDERRILTYSADKTARIWDAVTGEQLLILTGHTGQILGATWSKDGSHILTSSQDGTARIWNADTGKERVTFSGHTGEFWQATWNKDENRILTTSADGTVRIWYTRLADLLVVACRAVPRNFTWEEWQRFMDKAYQPTCPNAPIPPDAFTAIKTQISGLVQQGEVLTATAQLNELNQWLRTNGQSDRYGLTSLGMVLRDEGHALAQSGQITAALQSYQQALTLDPTLTFSPTVEAGRQAAQFFVKQGNKFAGSGQMTTAVQSYQQALTLDPSLMISPVVEAGRQAVSNIISQGDWLAQSGQITEAVQSYEHALALDPMQAFSPTVRANRYYGSAMLQQALTSASAGDITASLQAMQTVQRLAPAVLIDAQAWSDLCWQGSLWGQAEQVVDGACAAAVKLASAAELPRFRDQRGLARALSGDVPGALEDFKAFVATSTGGNLALRQTWIKRLTAGEAPSVIFDAAMLAQLQEE